MAEKLNLPKLTKENTQGVNNMNKEPTTGAGSTAPVSEVIDQEPIQTPVSEPVMQEPIQTPEVPVVEEPKIEEPTVVTPEFTVEPTVEEVKVEEKTPVLNEAPKQPVTKVETAQDIKTQEITNDNLTNELNEKKKTQVVSELDKMVQNGATLEEIQAFGIKHKEFRDDINATLKGSFKNIANTTYFGKYSTLNNEDMYAAYQRGEVVPGSNQYNLLPAEQRAKFDAFLSEKNAINVVKKTDYSTSEKVMDMTKLEAGIPKMFSSTAREKYEEKLNNPRLKELNAELTQNQVYIDEIDDKIEDLQETIEEQAGSGALISQVNSRYRQEYKLLMKDKRLALRERQIALGEYQSLKSDAETELKMAMYEDGLAAEEYKTQLSLYETRRKEALDRSDAVYAMEFKKQQAEFEATNKALAEDTQFKRDIALLEYKAMLADEGVTGEWEEREDGMYFLKSDGTAEKVLDAVNTPGITTNTVFEDGQAYTEVYDVNNQGIGFTTKNTALKLSEIQLLNAPNGTRIPTRLSKENLSPNNPGGKECGEYVNDIMARTVGQRIGSLWEEKLNYANETEGEVGSVVVWKVNPNVDDKYGHTGIIVGETQDKSQWLIKSSNIKGQGIVSVVKVPKSVINGYRSTGAIGTEPVFTQEQKTLLDSIDPVDLVKKENKEALKEVGLTLNGALKYKSENVATAKKEDYKTALNLIDKMMAAGDGDGFSDAIGLFSWARNTSDSGEITFDPGTDAADFKAQFDALVDGLTLPNLDKMSGVLTDKDIELLKNASKGGLSLTMSERDFKNAVQDLRGALNRAISGVKLPEGQVIYKDDDGIEYDKTTLTEALQKEIELYDSTNGKQGASKEDVRQFIIRNNLTTKLQ